MNIRKVLAMILPKWLRDVTEPLPPSKELRAEFKKLSKEINDETQEIKSICDERRRASQPPLVTNGHGNGN